MRSDTVGEVDLVRAAVCVIDRLLDGVNVIDVESVDVALLSSVPAETETECDGDLIFDSVLERENEFVISSDGEWELLVVTGSDSEADLVPDGSLESDEDTSTEFEVDLDGVGKDAVTVAVVDSDGRVTVIVSVSSDESVSDADHEADSDEVLD